MSLSSVVGTEIMGNNNVTGQQVSEETTDGADKTVEPSYISSGPNHTNSETNNEKDGTEDVSWSKSSMEPIITDAEDKQVASYQNTSSEKIEGLDEKNKSSIQYNTSTRDDHSSNLQKGDDEPLRKEATETDIFSSEIIALVSTTQDVTSYKDSSISNEKTVPFMHGTIGTNEETIQDNYKSMLQEKLEGLLEEQEETSSHDNSPMGGSPAGEDTTENLEQGNIEEPTVEDKLAAMQGETTSSTESIASTYLDADDSEIKEVVTEDKPVQIESRPDVQLLDGSNVETSKNDNMQIQIPHDKEENRGISKTATVKLMTESDETLEVDNNIHGLGNQDEDSTINTLCGNQYNDEVVEKCQPYLKNHIEINDPELGNEQNERVVGSRQSSGSVTTTVEHNGTESIYKEEGIVEKNITVWNPEDNFAAEKEPEEYYGNLVSITEVNGKEFTGLQSSISDHHHNVNEEIQRKVNGVTGIVEFDKETVKEILEEDNINNVEGLGLHFDAHVLAKEGGDLPNLPKAIPSTSLQSLEDIDREVYRTRDKQETITSPQGDQSQQIVLEKYEVLKLENGEILRKCMQLVGNSSNVVIISTDGINHEKVDTNTRSSNFTFETSHYQKEVTESTAAAAFTAQCNQVKVTESVDTATEEQHPLQASTPGREASEVSPLLQEVQDIGFPNSTEQHNQVHVEIPTADIAAMQFKAAPEKESERSPLLSPREPSGGDFIIPNHSARFKKPFQSLLTKGEAGMWSPLKEPESNSKSNTMVSSPRSKEKKKARSSLFISCMCCTTATN